MCFELLCAPHWPPIVASGEELLSSPRGSFRLLSCVPRPALSLPSPRVRSVVKHTHAEPHLPPLSASRRERRRGRSMLKSQLNPRQKKKKELVGWEVASLPDAASIRPSLFHVVKRADTGPFCRALIGRLVM